MRVFHRQESHHLYEDESSEQELAAEGAEHGQPTRAASAGLGRPVLDPPGSISIQLTRSISEKSFASFQSSPACFDGSGNAEIRSILRKSSRGGGGPACCTDTGLSQSSHEPYTTGGTSGRDRDRDRPRLVGSRSKSERNVTGTGKAKARRRKDPKHLAAQGHGPGSFLADLIASRRSAFVSINDDDDDADDNYNDVEGTDASPSGPPRFIHTITAASRTERRAESASRSPCPMEGPAVAPARRSFTPRDEASASPPASECDASDCPFDEDFMILHRRASERSLMGKDMYDDSALHVRTVSPAAATGAAPTQRTLCRGADRLAAIHCAPSNHQDTDHDAWARASNSPHSDVLHSSIAQISIDNPSVVDFVPHGSFGALPDPDTEPVQPPREDSAVAKPSLCGTIVTTTTTTTTTASSEEASSLEDSSSERSQPVHVMVNLSYLELAKASFSDEVCYLVD
jgi:hypothetical protein